MITLPDYAVGRVGTPIYMDKGALMMSELGGNTQRINRPGSRFRFSVELAPLHPEEANVVINRLIRAKEDKLRMAFPLTEQDQGSPGTTLVNGAISSGTKSLPVKGVTPGYVCKEGYWLSVVNADGKHFFHQVDAEATANGSGLMTLTVSPALRYPFADGNTVALAAPMIEGFTSGNEIEWRIDADRFLPLSFEIQEV